MKISDFSYINLNTEKTTLVERIEEFYVVNKMEDTLAHVRAVSTTNVSIAQLYHLDKETCYLAGLLHDISTVMKPSDMLIYAAAIGIDLDESEHNYPFLLHQQLSKYIAKTVFEVSDPCVLSAIECHTTLKSTPSKYDMALFIADKLSWNQDGKPPFYNTVNEALSISLESACFEYIAYMVENNKILYPHKWFLEAKSFLSRVLSK